MGVEDAEDRKKLYFLIQRLHTVRNSVMIDGYLDELRGGWADRWIDRYMTGKLS